MSADPEWWPDTAAEWIGLLMSIDVPQKAVRLEVLARHPETLESRQFFENLLDTSSSSEIELYAYMAIRADERQRGAA